MSSTFSVCSLTDLQIAIEKMPGDLWRDDELRTLVYEGLLQRMRLLQNGERMADEVFTKRVLQNAPSLTRGEKAVREKIRRMMRRSDKTIYNILKLEFGKKAGVMALNIQDSFSRVYSTDEEEALQGEEEEEEEVIQYYHFSYRSCFSNQLHFSVCCCYVVAVVVR